MADDYILKAVRHDGAVARIKAVLRSRTKAGEEKVLRPRNLRSIPHGTWWQVSKRL